MSPTEDQPESRAGSGPFRDVTEGIWELREAGPPDAERTVLLLAGALASARCYDALVGHSTLTAGSVRLVAATLPGFGRTPAPDDVTVENYGRLAADLAASLGADAGRLLRGVGRGPSQGLWTGPPWRGSVVGRMPNSGIRVVPSTTNPASRSRRTR